MPDPDVLIAVIAGGDTEEHESSVASGYNVFNSLRSRHACVLFQLHHGEWSVLSHHGVDLVGSPPAVDDQLRLVDTTTGRKIKPDVAVLCTHGFPGETGELQGFLAIRGIPFCSSGVLGSALAADKFRCSHFLHATCGLRIPRQQRITSAALSQASEGVDGWVPPFVLKPVSLGSSIGVVSVHDRRGMSAAFGQAAARGCDFVVEEFVDGLEVTAGAVRLGTGQVQLPVASVSRTGRPDDLGIRAYTDHKSVRLRIPAEIPAEAAALAGEEMRRIGAALNLFGCYRADFIWSAGSLYFLEVNTVPGLSENSVFTRLVEAAGLSLSDLLEELVAEALG